MMDRRRLAFVAGSNGPSWETQLRFASKDVERVTACLRSTCGFDVRAAPEQGDSHDVMRALTRVMGECRVGDDLIVYFSGHGALPDGRLFILWDATSTAVFDSAINVRSVFEAMQMCVATHKLLILDCCHAGAVTGLKGTDLVPAFANAGSQLILCASSRLERAREFDDLQGSFLAHNLCAALEESDPRSDMALPQLMDHLHAAATLRAGNVKTAVPTPFLFGEQKAPFVIRAATTRSRSRGAARDPVQVSIQDVINRGFRPDAGLLSKTLTPFEAWSEVRLFHDLPVEVDLPQEIKERVSTIQRYLDTDEWPVRVNDETKQQFADLLQKVLPDLVDSLQTSVRVAAAASIRLDGTVARVQRDRLLAAYISAKVFAAFRVLRSMWLYNETEPDWAAPFDELESVWSCRLIHGLTFIAERRSQWSFWTDADWHSAFPQTRYRVYLPQRTGRGTSEMEEHLTQTEVQQLMAPQLLEYSDRAGVVEDLRRVLTQDIDGATLAKELVVRGEVFVETEHHNSPESGQGVKARVSRIVATEIARQLMAVEPKARRARLAYLAPRGGELQGVFEMVFELMPGLGR